MSDKRIGRQTPTVGFTLPYQATRGADAIELYEKSGRQAFEWQKNIIYDMLALNDDGLWVHSRYGFSVPRQNGKNEIVSIREFYGVANGERILHTAHRTATSRSAWERLCSIIEAAGIHEIKGENRSGYRSGKSKGQEWVEFDQEHGGGRCSFRTRSTTGGLGETFDLLIIDEAQEYQDDQESALKYTIVSSQNPQTIYLGTPPTPYSSGTIFPNLRKDILTGNKKNAGWAEWSVESQTNVRDVDAWYETNPSLGLTLTERAIDDEIGADEVDFNIQRLGLWIRYNQKSAISRKDWDSCVTDKPKLVSALTVGIKFNHDGGSVSLSFAAKTDDERIFIECYSCRTMRDGVGWIVSLLRNVAKSTNRVIVDGANGVEMLTKEMTDAGLKKPHVITTSEFISANAAFEVGINSQSIVHMEQPSATQIATNVEKRAIGSGGGWGYRSLNLKYDISILDSMIIAAWGCATFTQRKKQSISY